MNFGQKLRKLRIEKGLTQQQLADRLGYKTNSYISDVESGHFIPSRDELKKIAMALDVPF
jgi:transcriptional regulator with XRE-family HTH domain